jgi:hypothetical protein
MAAELTIAGHEYRTGTLNAIQQFHIARRLAPIIAKLGAASGENATPLSAFDSLAEGISKLTDEDCDYVINLCMGTVRRKVGDTWLPAWNVKVNQPQYADIELPALIQLTLAVVQDQLGGFMIDQLPAGQALTTQIMQ